MIIGKKIEMIIMHTTNTNMSIINFYIIQFDNKFNKLRPFTQTTTRKYPVHLEKEISTFFQIVSQKKKQFMSI